MFLEGTALDSLESVDSRRFLPQALLATLLVIVAPALVVVALSPLSGIADLVLSALLATGLSVAAGTACSVLWTRLPQSREIPFGDLMLWAWARRVHAERRLAKAASGAALGDGRDLPAMRRLSVVFEARDGFWHGHSCRVARHAERIARRLGLPDDEVERIETAAAVHDIGLMLVPRTVLDKDDGDLTLDERALVERHVVDGGDKVAAAGADSAVAAFVRHHHERFDGSGYPDGLAGDEIPLGARIVAVADSFDDLVSPAPQRSPRSRRSALDELTARAGSELDPAVVAAFVAYYSGTRAIAGVAFAATAPQRAVRWIAAAPATIGAAAGTPLALQGICAAGTATLAGVCIGGLPALSPDRDGDRPAAERRAAEDAGSGGGDAAARPVVATDPTADRRGGRTRAHRDAVAPTPRSGAPQGSPESGGGGGGGTAPPSPQTGGGPKPTTGGGGGNGGGGGGAGGGGGSSPSNPLPTQPPVPATPPQVEVPPIPINPAPPLVDPLLDGVSETVPRTRPLTDAAKGLLGGLTGGQ